MDWKSLASVTEIVFWFISSFFFVVVSVVFIANKFARDLYFDIDDNLKCFSEAKGNFMRFQTK